jgi:hypothetical protein
MKPVKKSGSRVIAVNFKGVSTDGGAVVVPEDNYEVEAISNEVADGPKAQYVNWKLKIRSGEFKDKSLYHITTLAPEGLFNLKATIEAMGFEVPDSLVNLNLDTYLHVPFGVTTENEIQAKGKGKGKERSRIVDVFPLGQDSEPSTEETPAEEEIVEKSETEEESGKDSEAESGDSWTEDEAEKHWSGLKPVERTKTAADAGLTGKWGKKEWKDLTDEDKKAIYGLGGEEPEPETEEKETGKGKPLTGMNLKELLAYAEEQEITLTPKQSLSVNSARKAIEVALEA